MAIRCSWLPNSTCFYLDFSLSTFKEKDICRVIFSLFVPEKSGHTCGVFLSTSPSWRLKARIHRAADGATAAGRELSDIVFKTSAPDHPAIPRKVGPQQRTLGTDPLRWRSFGAVQLHKLCICFATVGTDTLSKNTYCWVVFLSGTHLCFYFGK